MRYMKDATGRRLDSFEVQSLRKPTIVLCGESRTADCDFVDSFSGYSTNMSWFDWGQANLPQGPVFDVLRNAGIGGNTTTQMQARMAADVLAYSPSHMTLWGGTNDGRSNDVPVRLLVIRCRRPTPRARWLSRGGGLKLRSRIFTAPAATYSGVTILLRIGFAGAGSATVRLGRIALKMVD